MNRYAALLALFLALVPATAWTHGLLVSAEAKGSRIDGRVYYSDGTPAADEYVELKQQAAPAKAEHSTVTDRDGRFGFEATGGERYLVVAHGEEGHRTEIEITLKAGERGRIVEPDDTETESDGIRFPPAWMLIGGLLLLSLVPAFIFILKRVGRT